MPNYPTIPDAHLLDANCEGRDVNKIEFTQVFKIGDFRAHGCFGDGCFSSSLRQVTQLDICGH